MCAGDTGIGHYDLLSARHRRPNFPRLRLYFSYIAKKYSLVVPYYMAASSSDSGATKAVLVDDESKSCRPRRENIGDSRTVRVKAAELPGD